jgi:hypothetical protein
MNSVLTNPGTSTLGGTTVTSLNSLTWPTGTQPVGSVLTICAGATGAYWAVPGAVSLSGWWNVVPNASLNMNNNGITNLPSINGVQINLSSTLNLIAIGNGALAGSVSAGGNDIIAIGLSAGAGAAGSNLIYLGNNPGGTQAYDNWFTVYSTTSGLPFLQGDMSNMRLGIGKTPSVALDVSGSAFVSQALNVSGLTTLTNARAVTLSASTIYSSGTINSGGTATLNAVSIPTTLGVTGTSTLGTTGTGALTASSITTGGTLGVTGQTNLTTAVVSSTLNVTGVSTLTRVDAGQINGTSLASTGGLNVTGTSTLGTTNVGALTVTGTSALGTTTASTLTATSLVAQGTLNAASATSTLGTTTVNTTLNVLGSTNLSSAVLSQNLTVCGETLFRNLSFTSLNSLTWNSPGAGGTVLSVDATRRVLSWVSLTSVGLENWAQSVANSTISLQGLYGITGITSFNNVSAVFNSALAQVGLGAGALSNNPASNIVAFGTGAGNYPGNSSVANVYSNNLFLGSNPGGSCNVANSLVIYSQTNGSPLIYGDLARNQVTIGGQTNTAGYTLNVNGSAQATTLNSPASSSNSIGGVTMSNSILTAGRINNLSNLNGIETKFDSANQVIFIGQKFGNDPIPSGSVNVFLGQFAGANYTGAGTVGIGPGAGAFLTGSNNTCIGPNAGNSSTGSCNNFIGTFAGQVNTGSFVNAIGLSAALGNQAAYVDAMGSLAAYGMPSAASNTVAIGRGAGYSNKKGNSIFIGRNAGENNDATYLVAIGDTAGRNNTGQESVSIGSIAGSGNEGNYLVALGSRAAQNNKSANVIALGESAAIPRDSVYGGRDLIAIGTTALYRIYGGVRDVIGIGRNAGSNAQYSNSIFLGSNLGYNTTTPDTFVVYSTIATAPALQADLSNRRLGVGGAPSYSLDVQTTSAGSNGVRIAQNNTSNVTAGLFLEAGIIPAGGGETVLNTTLVSFATRGGGGGTVIQSLMSLFEGGEYGLSIKNGNTISSETFVRVSTAGRRMGLGTVSPGATLDVSGTFRVTGGAATLSGVTLNVLNGVRWPSTAGALNTQLVINAVGEASWQPPGAIDSASWSINPALQTVNMAGFGLTGLSSINGLTTTICSVTNQIGIGANVLGNNTASNVVALGSNAGSNAAADSTWSNCVYLGSNPGTTANGANTFLLYSTTAGIPALQVNMASRQLGVGMVPSNALDVTGAARISSTLTSIGNVTIGTIPSPKNYSLNINGVGDTTGMIAFYNTATTPQPQFGIGFDKAAGGLAIKANSGGTDFTGTAMFMKPDGRIGLGMIDPAHLLDVAGQINTSVRFSSPSTSSNSIGGVTMSNSILTVGTISGVQNLNGQNLKIDGTIGLIGIGPNMNIGGRSNIAIGNYAGYGYSGTGTSEGGQLIAIGGSAGYGSGGVSNTLIGYHAGEFNYGSVVNAIGYYAGESNKESYVNALGVFAAWSNAASNVDAIGHYAGYQNISRGTNLIAIGSNAGYGNHGASNIYIGAGAGNGTFPNFNSNSCNAIVIGSLAGVFTNGAANIGNRSINIGTGSTTSQGSENQIAIGTGANGAATGSIAIGAGAIAAGGFRMTVIGSNAAGGSGGGSDVIAIGTNAGSNLPALPNNIYIGSNAGYRPTTSNTLVVQSTSATAPTLQADLSNRWLGIGRTPSAALDVAGTIRSSGPVISTLNVAGITSGTSITLTPDNATTYYSLTTTTGTTLTLTLPATAPPQGTYWVLKNNAAVNYTFTSTNGVFNAGSNSYYLQAGIGITLAYSGTSVNGSPAYYTF